MSLIDMVVCQFPDCANRIYKDARLLPCGNRVCSEHIESMLVVVDGDTIKCDENSNASKCTRICCPFCNDIHSQPADKEFPRDKLIPFVLDMKHCDEHEAAKHSFVRLSQQLADASRFDKRRHLDDYFKRVEVHIDVERETVKLDLDTFYDKLQSDLNAFKSECVRQLEAAATTTTTNDNEFQQIENALEKHASSLRERDVEFRLRTMSGDDAAWRSIRADCDSIGDEVRALEDAMQEKLILYRPIRFEPLKEPINFASICGSIDSYAGGHIDSLILDSTRLKWSLRQLCRFDIKTNIELLYRASRDGFSAAPFHVKCDKKGSTLTVIKSANANIFGGFTTMSWDISSLSKEDPHAFLFSLVNQYNQPRRIPIRAAKTRYAIFCGKDAGPHFGEDIQIRSNMSDCVSNLGQDYEFATTTTSSPVKTKAEIQAFLAGAGRFKVIEMEVFAINNWKFIAFESNLVCHLFVY